MDLSFQKLFQSAKKSNSILYKRFIYWFCKHYFCCDIHPNDNLSSDIEFAHNALGIVINKEAVVGEHVTIQHHVTIGSTGKGVPYVSGGYILEHMQLLSEMWKSVKTL